jgi:acyl carrier protein
MTGAAGSGRWGVIQDQIRSFVMANFYVAESDELRDDESLLDSGVIDSTGVLELIDFVESTYKFRITDAEMTPENLESIDAIAAYVARRSECVGS